MASAAEDWLAGVRALVTSDDGRVGLRAMDRIEDALKEHPDSCSLWCLRGDLIQLLEDGESDHYSLEDAVSSYKGAAEIDSTDPEPLEALGFYFDAVDEQLPEAERFFRRALSLSAGPAAYAGRARVLAQLGRAREALEVLSKCPHHSAVAVVEAQNEISNGYWNGPGAAG